MVTELAWIYWELTFPQRLWDNVTWKLELIGRSHPAHEAHKEKNLWYLLWNLEEARFCSPAALLPLANFLFPLQSILLFQPYDFFFFSVHVISVTILWCSGLGNHSWHKLSQNSFKNRLPRGYAVNLVLHQQVHHRRLRTRTRRSWTPAMAVDGWERLWLDLGLVSIDTSKASLSLPPLPPPHHFAANMALLINPS